MMRVLSSYPCGLATHAAVKRDLAFLASSGPDWAQHSRRLGAVFPLLDVFSSRFIRKYSFGWRLTPKGAIVLEMMEEAARNLARNEDVSRMPSEPEEMIMEIVSSFLPVTEPLASTIAPADRRSLFTVIDGGRSKAA
jgi:hypothetical protein